MCRAAAAPVIPARPVQKRKSAIAVLVNLRTAVRKEKSAARVRKEKSAARVLRGRKVAAAAATAAAATTTVIPAAENWQR